MWFGLAWLVVVMVLTYFGSGFFLTHYTRSDYLGIRKASLAITGGFLLFLLSMGCESLIPGRTGHWVELCMMAIICFGTLTIVLRILAKSGKCPR
jgi:hypothetical protein